MTEKFYITTAIDYPSSDPHLGHAYEKLTADVIARWNRLLGKKVFFLTGTDEHGFKIQKIAKKAKMKPEEFVNKQVPKFQELCKKWNISNDRFIRTTESAHEKIAQEIFQKVYDNGDIYLDNYTGYYCTECETFYLEKDLIDGKCPTHKKKCDWVEEESYFFKMSKYEKEIRNYFAQKLTVLPVYKKEEMLNRMKKGLKDLSVSRKTLEWGIKLPINEKHRIYVWFDALLNYVSGVNFNGEGENEFWPADIHLIGKDILWHHSVIWWAMLKSAGIELPKTILVHGFINTASGEKMSKSKGNVIDPIILADKYPIDALRYFLIREIPFGEDGFFDEKLVKERLNNELANDLGNLVNRTLTLIEKNFEGKIPKASTANELKEKLDLDLIKKRMKKFELHLALGEIMNFSKSCNQFINEKEPWKQKGKDLEKTLYSLADSIRILGILIQPFMPETSEKINSMLSVKAGKLNEAKFDLLKPETQLGKKELLFKKIE